MEPNYNKPCRKAFEEFLIAENMQLSKVEDSVFYTFFLEGWNRRELLLSPVFQD